MLEIMTYRFRGHSMGDPERYRKHDEVVKWEEEDPIGIYRKYLLEHEIATAAELDEQDENAMAEVLDAVEFAEASPEPGPEELYQHIYVEE
jgi:pyruvate dehydrogenase E1 component alpha subunit